MVENQVWIDEQMDVVDKLFITFIEFLETATQKKRKQFDSTDDLHNMKLQWKTRQKYGLIVLCNSRIFQILIYIKLVNIFFENENSCYGTLSLYPSNSRTRTHWWITKSTFWNCYVCETVNKLRNMLLRKKYQKWIENIHVCVYAYSYVAVFVVTTKKKYSHTHTLSYKFVKCVVSSLIWKPFG